AIGFAATTRATEEHLKDRALEERHLRRIAAGWPSDQLVAAALHWEDRDTSDLWRDMVGFAAGGAPWRRDTVTNRSSRSCIHSECLTNLLTNLSVQLCCFFRMGIDSLGEVGGF